MRESDACSSLMWEDLSPPLCGYLSQEPEPSHFILKGREAVFTFLIPEFRAEDPEASWSFESYQISGRKLSDFKPGLCLRSSICQSS